MAKGVAPYAQYAPMRILVLTIEEDPPSLKSYADDKQRTGAPFSKYFEDFYKKCLQKVNTSTSCGCVGFLINILKIICVLFSRLRTELQSPSS